MVQIVNKKILSPQITQLEVLAPFVARKAEAGQFIILRANENGERIPLTIADFNRDTGTITVIFQVVGATTRMLNCLNIGDSIHDFVGPLGIATETEGLQKVAVVGGGVGCAIAWPIAKKLHQKGAEVHVIAGFRTKEFVILENELKNASSRFVLMTDDGTHGQKGLVTNALKALIESKEEYDHVITIGPLLMMKFVCKLTQEYGIKTIASMNPVMIDGTGMCGGCRLTVAGKTKFACVDGPDFNGHEIEFDEAIARSSMYSNFERTAHEKVCNLLIEGVK